LSVVCTISVSDAVSATTGVASDYSVSSTVDSSPLVSTDGGFTFTFSTTPYVITTMYSILVQATGSQSAIAMGTSSFVVYGNPTNDSSLVCSNTLPARAGLVLYARSVYPMLLVLPLVDISAQHNFRTWFGGLLTTFMHKLQLVKISKCRYPSLKSHCLWLE
jgi:hypothetical protein